MRAGGTGRLARRAGRGYARDMVTRSILFFLAAATLAACDDGRKPSPKRSAHTASKARSGAEDVGRKTEKAFRHVGGHLEKFFTGHDTISR